MKNKNKEIKDNSKISKKIILADNITENFDLIRYNEAMLKLCLIYREVIFLFFKEQNSEKIEKLSNYRVFKKLIDIFNKMKENKKFSIFLENKINLNTIALSTDKNISIETVKKNYIEYEILCKEIENIIKSNSEKKIAINFQKINNMVLTESNKKNYRDKISYYFTPKDDQIFTLFASWVVSVHALVFAIISVPVMAASGSVVLPSLATYGLIRGFSNASYLGFRFYNIVLRKSEIYNLNTQDFDDLSKEIKKLFDLNKMKDNIKEVEKINLKIGTFNFYFSNSFKYYSYLKENTDKYSDKFSREYFLNEKKSKEAKNNTENLYYKTLYYFRAKKAMQSSLYSQLEALKKLTIESVYLLRENPIFTNFIENNKKIIPKIIDKVFINISRKFASNEQKRKQIECIKHYVSLTLKSDKNKLDENKTKSIDLNLIHDFEKSILNDLKFVSTFPVARSEGIKFLEVAQSEGIGHYLNSISSIFTAKDSKKIIDPGLWLLTSTVELFLFASKQIPGIDKYKRFSCIINNMSAFYTTVDFLYSSTLLLSRNWINFFSDPIMGKFYTNPFDIVLSLLEYRFTNIISSNYLGIWNDIYEDFNKYKDKNKDQIYPNYEYFNKVRRILPGEAIHKLSDIFKEKFCKVSTTLGKINKNTIDIMNMIEDLENECFSRSKLFCFSKTKPEDLIYNIIYKYVKTILKILSVSKEIEIIEHYIHNVYEFDPEIDKTLQINFALLNIDTKTGFALTSFALDPSVSKEIFS